MFITMTFILTVGCLALTIGIYTMARNSRGPLSLVAKLIHLSPLFAFIFNLAVSFLLTQFIGVGMAAGAANLIASIIFPLYVMARKNSPVKKSIKPSNTLISTSVVQKMKEPTNAGLMIGKAIKNTGRFGFKTCGAVAKGGLCIAKGIYRGIKTG